MRVEELKTDLAAKADPSMKAWARDHLGMNVDHFLGCRMPVIREMSKAIHRKAAQRQTSIDTILNDCDTLLEDGTYELRLIAFQWIHLARKQLESRHIDVLETWLKTYVDDWSDGDELCTHALGGFLITFPEWSHKTRDWACSQNQWLRRGASVALIPGLRNDQFLGIALAVCNTLLEDNEPLVRKGWVWTLREAGKQFPEEIRTFVTLHEASMSKTEQHTALKNV